MNAVLNREWRDAYNELGAPVVETANSIIHSTCSKFAKVVPLDVWFPEKV